MYVCESQLLNMDVQRFAQPTMKAGLNFLLLSRLSLRRIQNILTQLCILHWPYCTRTTWSCWTPCHFTQSISQLPSLLHHMVYRRASIGHRISHSHLSRHSAWTNVLLCEHMAKLTRNCLVTRCYQKHWITADRNGQRANSWKLVTSTLINTLDYNYK